MRLLGLGETTFLIPTLIVQLYDLNLGRVKKGAVVYMIRKLKSGKYRLYASKKDPKTGKRRNLGTFDTREEAEKHERAVQFFKHQG